MKEQKLQAEARLVTGHQVKKLRVLGKVPASIYGRNTKSTSIAIDTKTFLEVYKIAGETGLIDLSLGGEARPVLVHHVQVHPVDGELLHVEFLQVDLKQKVKAHVPVVLEGEAPAIASGEGVLLTFIDELEVEALPKELPEKITLDVTVLSSVGSELKVSDVKVSSGVVVLTDADVVIVRVGALISKQTEVQLAEEAASAAQASTAAEEGAAASAADASVTESGKEATKEANTDAKAQGKSS